MEHVGAVQAVSVAGVAALVYAGTGVLSAASKLTERERAQVRMTALVVTGACVALGVWTYALLAALVAALASHATLWAYVRHPHELVALVRFKLAQDTLPRIPDGLTPEQRYCYEKLVQTSRSFSTVILHLHPKLREAVAVFYLVCRAIDTVEDDMNPSASEKVPHLRTFHTRLAQAGWNLHGYGEVAHERDLLEHFDRVIAVYATFPPAYQTVIASIADAMGNGMADFLDKRVESLAEYDLYCYYVAGLVGEGLSRLFAASGLEDASFATAKELWNSMGLFLQKTNIIRDYREDIDAVNARVFYPKAIWGKYVARIDDLKAPQHRTAALACLNDMVTNALEHVPACVDYLDRLSEPSVFTFCAIPQTMAIATLALCYNNGAVLEGEVKIRKGEAVHLILASTALGPVLRIFAHYLRAIAREVPPTDPNAARTHQVIAAALRRVEKHPRYAQ